MGLSWAEAQRVNGTAPAVNAATTIQNTVQSLLARDSAELEERTRAQQLNGYVRDSEAELERKKVLRAMIDYGAEDWKAEEKGDTGGGLGENCNKNVQNVKDILAEGRAKMAAEHAARQAKSKEAERADKLKRAEAKKKAQERSKANEARRGGRSM